jgi:nitrate/TMAO reductase-like tetraheme cytochrome c subunit
MTLVPVIALLAAASPCAAQTPPANDDCLACHNDASLTRSSGTSVAVKPDVHATSVHGPLACVDCHADLGKTTEWPHAEKLQAVSCAACHEEAAAQLRASVHDHVPADAARAGPRCVDCHGSHDIRTSKDPASRTFHLNVAATCGTCHGGAMPLNGRIATDVTADFADGIHGRALARGGLMVAPTCSSCHNAHDIRSPEDPESKVVTAHVPDTCGTCHEGIRHQFRSGAHGAALAAGKSGVPACQTCHTAHAIQRGENPEWQLSAITQCGTCHEKQKDTFRDTFHGKVTSLGSRVVAGCADCHGAHEVLPASDARSPVAPGRLVETCGRCHSNATASFVQYDPHADPTDYERGRVLWWANWFYWVLIPGMFGFFGLHSALWFWRSTRGARTPAEGGRS